MLAPQAHRGRRNEPLYVSEVLLELARVRETPAAELSERLVGNADEVFRWRRV
ncbi:MAG TPA: hypothetical protein VKX16_09095 [Chloroflexota bacterium]|nr:hypothetical protein [Chloroflexota bacterium]